MAKKQAAAKTQDEQEDAKGTRSPRPVSLEELLDFANRIARFSRRFREISERSKQLNVGPLMATAFPSAKRGEELLTMFLTSLVSGLEDLERLADKNRDEFAEQRPDAQARAAAIVKEAADKGITGKGANTPDQSCQ